MRREFGTSGVRLSPLTFGCMRLDPKRLELADAVRLVEAFVDAGMTAFHSSHEYETFPFFCEVLGRFLRDRPGSEIQHVVKIGVPHFTETRFDGGRFQDLIDSQLKALRTDCLDLVQWLVRQTPNEDTPRLRALDEGRAEFVSCWERLVRAGKVRAVGCFPYSAVFAERALSWPSIGGLVDYLNPVETERAAFLDGLAQRGQGFVAIRPLFGGRMTADRVPGPLLMAFGRLGVAPDSIADFCLEFPLLHPAVASSVVSLGSEAHVAAAVAAVHGLQADRARFEQAVGEFRGAR